MSKKKIDINSKERQLLMIGAGIGAGAAMRQPGGELIVIPSDEIIDAVDSVMDEINDGTFPWDKKDEND